LKKLAAIFILCILLFNIVGYRWMFTCLENAATAKLEQTIDAGNFSDDQLVEIKVPLNMPYYSDKDYEPAYGETEWNGQHYRYVKRKVSGNTLYLLCIQNPDKNKILSEKNNFTKATGEAQQNNSPARQHPSAIKLMLSEFISQENKKTETIQLLTSSKKYLTDSRLISQFDPLTTTQPPDITA
jgi:hypothetical protein